MLIHYKTAHRTAEDMDRVARTIRGFGYTIQDSIRLSRQVRTNLDNYARQYDLAITRATRRLADSVKPTQTNFWKETNGEL